MPAASIEGAAGSSPVHSSRVRPRLAGPSGVDKVVRIPVPALDPKAGPPTLYPDEPRSQALVALCRHLGRYKARGFVQLLWGDEQPWWLEHEWNRMRGAASELPAYDIAALREIFPRSLVPCATSMRDVSVSNRALIEALFGLMDGRDTLEAATTRWLAVQRAHGVAVVRSEDGDQERSPDERNSLIAALDAIAPASRPTDTGRAAFALVASMLDRAPLLLDSAAFCNQFDWVSDVWIGLTWSAWAEALEDWELRHERFGQPDFVVDWSSGGPDVPDYEPWRDAWIRVLDESSRRIHAAR